jgi:hypothetical protein
MGTILLIILVLLLIGALPTWPYILARDIGQWRTRLDPFDCSCPRLDGTNLSKNQDSA